MNGFKFNCVKHNICKEKSNYHDDRFVDVKFRSSSENIEICVKIISWYCIISFMIFCKDFSQNFDIVLWYGLR